MTLTIRSKTNKKHNNKKKFNNQTNKQVHTKRSKLEEHKNYNQNGKEKTSPKCLSHATGENLRNVMSIMFALSISHLNKFQTRILSKKSKTYFLLLIFMDVLQKTKKYLAES